MLKCLVKEKMGQTCRKLSVCTPNIVISATYPHIHTYSTFTTTETRDILEKALAPKNMNIGDRTYLAYTKNTLIDFLNCNVSDKHTYVSETFDCDDFARVLVGREREWFATRVNTKNGSTFGTVWGDIRLVGGKNKANPHAMNVFIDNNRNVYLIEPQTDVIYSITNALPSSTFWTVEM